MRSFQEFKGKSTRLDYNRERGEFVAKAVPHPFNTRNAVTEVQNEHKKLAAGRPGARAAKILSFMAPVRSLAASNRARELKTQQDPSRDKLAGYEGGVRHSVVVGLALAGIVMWIGFVVA